MPEEFLEKVDFEKYQQTTKINMKNYPGDKELIYARKVKIRQHFQDKMRVNGKESY